MTNGGRSLWDSVYDGEKEKPSRGREKTAETVDLKKVYSQMKDTYKDVKREVARVIVGQEDTLEQLLIAIFTDNHTLLEGFPGLGGFGHLAVEAQGLPVAAEPILQAGPAPDQGLVGHVYPLLAAVGPAGGGDQPLVGQLC